MVKKDIVKKFSDYGLAVIDNNFIEGQYDMNASQLKLFIALVSLIEKNDKEFNEYKISSKALMKILNVSDVNNVYGVVDKVTDKLMEKIAYVKDKEKKFFSKYTFFSRMEFKDGILTVKFNEDIKPFLLQLQKEFTKFKLSEFKPFSSKYSIRIYQLLKQYENIGKRSFDVSELREILNIKANELKNFGDFRKRVIDIAQRELEDTPLNFTYEIVKRGRGGKVSEITFILKKPEEKSDPLKNALENTKDIKNTKDNQLDHQAPDILENKELFEQIKELYKTIPQEYKSKALDNSITQSINQKGYLYTKQNLQYVLNQKNIKNFNLYFAKALQNDWGNAASSDIEVRIKQEEAKQFFEIVKDSKFYRNNKIYSIQNCIYNTQIKKYSLECKFADEQGEEHKSILDIPYLEGCVHFEWLDDDTRDNIKKLFDIQE